MSAGGRKIFLGGLTKSTTTDMLFESFGVFGQVVDAVVMERNGHPRGFGFVTYKEKSSVNAAIAAGVMIDGRDVDLKRAVPEEDMTFCPSKVFIGGLSQNVDKASLKQHFEAFGEVRDAVVMMDRATSRSRGFGFVRFATSEGVEAALRTPHLLDGQWIDVKRAQPADALPAPKYPRTRAEEEMDMPEMKAQPVRKERGGKKRAPAAPAYAAPMAPPAPDMAAQMAMLNWLAMAAQQPNAFAPNPYAVPNPYAGPNPYAPNPYASAYPPTATPFSFPPVGLPDASEISALLASIGAAAPTASTTPQMPSEPVTYSVPKMTVSEKGIPLLKERAFGGNLSNVLESAMQSPAKSPMKSPAARFPSNSPINRENAEANLNVVA